MNTIKHSFIRFKNAFHYKVGMKFPFSKVRVRAMKALGHDVGNEVYFPADLVLTQNFVKSRGKLHLGNRVSIGPGCIFVLSSHANASRVRIPMKSASNEITIHDDAWIGAGSIILPGVTIGECSVVGAGSVVTKDVPSYTVVVGNPAKVLRKIEL